jgi:hypothetical protein
MGSARVRQKMKRVRELAGPSVGLVTTDRYYRR